MNITLILNRDAGTLRGLDATAAGEEIAGIFRAQGHAVDVRVSAGKDAVDEIRKACKAGDSDAVVVGGGDGTVSAAAAAAAKGGVALGILPLGTMNFFARSLQIPLEMKGAAEALAAGDVDTVDIAEINGRTFVHAVSLGIHPAMVEEREKLSYNSRYGKMMGSVRAWIRVLRNSRRFGVILDVDGARIGRRTAGIVVSNNPLGEGHLPYADRLDTGNLALYVTKARGWLQLVRVTASAALGKIAEDPLVEVHLAEETEIETGDRAVPVTVDGELLRMQGPLKVRIVPGGLKVLKPKVSAE